MSSCRCRDITVCEERILRLRHQIDKLPGYVKAQAGLDDEILVMRAYDRNCMLPEYLETIGSRLEQLTSLVSETNSKVSGRMYAEVERLNSSLWSMKSEDSAYHEEERRREEEARQAVKNKKEAGR